MKNIHIILATILFISIVSAQEIIIMDQDVTYNSAGFIDNSKRLASGIRQGGKDITATGILRLPIVFVRFADDNNITTHWPVANQCPSWAKTFVNSEIPSNGIYTINNFSKFYDLSSGGNGNGILGNFQVIGDVYYINLPYNRSYYANDGEVTIASLNILDDPLGPFKVDFRKYDNWEFKVGGEFYEHDYRPFDFETGTSADGLLDFMLIYWKSKSQSADSTVGGRADLGLDSTIIKDGISIADTMGVIGFKAEKFGLEHTIWISAHEIGHHQFGITNFNVGSHFNGRNDNFGNLQSFGLMTTAMGHQFSAYERYRLGWLDPIYATSSLNAYIINDTHKSNSDNALIIPVRYDIYGRMAEYFLLENYHTTHAYSGANPFLTKNLFNHVFTKGIIVYHVSDENFDWPTLSKIDIESAEGLFDWEVIEGASTPNDRLDDLIAPITKDVINGFDERDNITAIAETVTYTDYLALTPSSSTLLNDQKRRRYNSDDWLGDQEDLFSIEYNKVFTKWSNPSSVKFDTFDSYKGFEIISYNSSTHQYNIKVGLNYNDIINLSPSKPQNFKVVQNGNNAYLTWNQNNEPDVLLGGKYKIYRTITNGGDPASWVNIATVNHPTTNWTDPDLYITGTGSKKVFYSVSALDNTNLESVKSEHDFLYFNNLLQKQTQEKEDIAKVIEYKLQDNYPNPFNPTTLINYQIPEDGFVSLTIYNTLGEIVSNLVNEYLQIGRYTVQFNADDLPSGVYIYRLKVNDFVTSKKMMLLK